MDGMPGKAMAARILLSQELQTTIFNPVKNLLVPEKVPELLSTDHPSHHPVIVRWARERRWFAQSAPCTRMSNSAGQVRSSVPRSVSQQASTASSDETTHA